VTESAATSFGSVAESYDGARPVSAPGAVEWLLPPAAVDVVELGAGTGRFTRQLTPRVPNVIATDPDQRMLDVLQRNSPGISTIVAHAEEIPLPDASVDAVLASEAWHWFDPERAPREIARLLRPGGRVGTAGTVLDPEVDFVGELVALLLTDRGVHPPWEDIAAPLTGPFTVPERAEFRWSATTNTAGIIQQLSAWSPVFRAEPAERTQLLAQAESIIRKRFPDDRVAATYRTLCFRCDKT
jgi:SAM-dependent methyltransferase